MHGFWPTVTMGTLLWITEVSDGKNGRRNGRPSINRSLDRVGLLAVQLCGLVTAAGLISSSITAETAG